MLKNWNFCALSLKYHQAIAKKVLFTKSMQPASLKLSSSFESLRRTSSSFFSTSKREENYIRNDAFTNQTLNMHTVNETREQSAELLKFQNYSFRKLTREYREEAIELIAHEFDAQEPLTNSFFRKFPEEPKHREQKWKDFWGQWMDNACSNNISVTIHDSNSHNELIGLFLTKDLLYEPEGLSQKYMQNLNFISSVIELQSKLIEQVDPSISPQLSKPHNVADFWGAAIQKKHLRNNLLSKMMVLSEQLANKQGFRYAFGYATNFKSQKALKRQNFQMIGRGNAKQSVCFGALPFELIEQEQKYPSIWLKHLD